MEEERISGRQFGILTFVMMLAPLIHAIPLRTAGAGRASWLITFPVVIPLGVLFYFLFRCLEPVSYTHLPRPVRSSSFSTSLAS